MSRKESNRIYYLAHRKQCQVRNRLWKAKNKERKRQMDKEWRENNKDKKHENDRLYYIKNRDIILEYMANYRKNNSDKIHAYTRTKVRFHDKQIPTGTQFRKDECSECKRKIGIDEIKRTNMHHERYDINNPLSHTVELCIRCHRKRHQSF